MLCLIFFFNDTATTEIYTLSLHDALPICRHARARPAPDGRRRPDLGRRLRGVERRARGRRARARLLDVLWRRGRSEEHTSELQSRQYLVCRLLLEKKKKQMSALLSSQYLI